MRILIIGGTRFIGPFVVKELQAGGHSVAVFHRGQTYTSTPPEVREILGDRARLADRRDEIRDFAPDAVIDMIPYTEEDARSLVAVLTGLTGKLVAVSSADVYRAYGRLIGTEPGIPDPLPLTEESPLREKMYPYRGEQPRPADDPQRWMDDYDKILVERIVLGQAGLLGTVLRLPAVYGPGDRQRRIFPYLKRMDDARPAILLEQNVVGWRWSRGYVEDVAAAIALAAVSPQAVGQVYNVAETETLNESEWVTAIGQAAGWNGRIVGVPEERLPEPLRFDVDTRQDLLTSSAKIRHELGYRERFDRPEALRRTIAWDRANPPETLDPKMFDYAAEDNLLFD
jgi:nucleoside-diphosphate-sugar epimerase